MQITGWLSKMKMGRKQTIKGAWGFTIVELLIVIVVIAILAAISIVAYTGIQARARDNVRKQDVANIAKALKLYAIDKGGFMSTGSGCGGSGNGGGWYNYEGGSGYTTSISNCLINEKYVNKEILDPSGIRACGGLECRAYFVTNCIQNSQHVTYVYANLETVGHTSTDTDTTCSTVADTDIGMNYFIKIN